MRIRLPQRRVRTLAEELWLVVRIFLIMFAAALLLAGFTVSLTAHTWVILAALVVFVLAAATNLLRGTLRIVALTAAVLIMAGITLFRASRMPEPVNGEFRTMPGESRFRAISAVIPEEDGIFLASRVFRMLGGITSRENTGLLSSLEQTYAAMRRMRGPFPTPLAATYLGMQERSSFDLLALQAASQPSLEQGALVFLHGSGGNWTLLCWIVSEAAGAQGLDTFCPSAGPLGNWGLDQGRAVFEATKSMLQKRGYTRLFLAGLSAGAVGASQLSADGQASSGLSGAIIICGIHPDIVRSQLPMLVIYSKEDERFPAHWVRAFAEERAKHSPPCAISAVAGDHFALLKEAETVKTIISRWLGQALIPG